MADMVAEFTKCRFPRWAKSGIARPRIGITRIDRKLDTVAATAQVAAGGPNHVIAQRTRIVALGVPVNEAVFRIVVEPMQLPQDRFQTAHEFVFDVVQPAAATAGAALKD